MFFIKKIRPDKSIQKFKYSFAQYKKPYVRSPTKSFWEHMIKTLFQKEIKFDDCQCSAPYGTIQQILGYIIHNPTIDQVCVMCAKKKSPEVTDNDGADASVVSTMSGWYCDNCTYHNPTSDQACVMCAKKKSPKKTRRGP